MSAAQAASRKPRRLSQRITRQRTRLVSAARSAYVIGPARMNTGGKAQPEQDAEQSLAGGDDDDLDLDDE